MVATQVVGDSIYEAGFHKGGGDTKFHLKERFRVVAAEANPTLCFAGD